MFRACAKKVISLEFRRNTFEFFYLANHRLILTSVSGSLCSLLMHTVATSVFCESSKNK